MHSFGDLMQKADLTTRAVAGFIDLLLVIALTRLPDILGMLSATGYILIRDGLFDRQSVGKKLIQVRMAFADEPGRMPAFRESIIRNTTLAVAYLLFLIPYAGWIAGPLALAVEALTALGDDRGMRVGDLFARTWIVPTAPPAMDQQPEFTPPGTGDPQDD